MKIEKKYLPPPITEVLAVILAFILAVNLVIYLLLGLLRHISFAEIFNKNWLPLLATPVIMGMVHALTNRNVILKISSHGNLPLIRQNIEAMLAKNGYKKISSDDYFSSFEFASTGKMILYLGRGRVNLTLKNDELEIRGRIRIMDKIETKLRWNETFISQIITE